MFELFRVLVKNSGFILFVIFECIAFYLIINFNRTQREIFLYSSNVFSASILNQYNKVNDYFRLEDINKKLSDENARLNNIVNNPRYISSAIDSGSTSNPSYNFIGARVISNSINHRNNYFLIDKGIKNGLSSGMGVVSDNKPVGIIHRATSRYANVLSFLNTDFNLSSKIKNTGYFGTVHWNPMDPKEAELEFIPKHANVVIGDTVITSGYSTVFPPDLLIGVIKEKKLLSGSNFFNIKIEIISDLGKMEYVHVVESLNKNEVDSLRVY